MIKAPQSISTETTDALNALIAASDRLRDWNSAEIQSLVHATERLQRIDAREAFVRRGFIAAICGELDRMDEYFRKAMLLPNEIPTKHEFHAALGNAGLYGRAHQLGGWLLDPKRGFFPSIWERAISMGQILAVSARIPDAKKTFPELSDSDFGQVERAAAVMQERGLTDEDIASVFDRMGEVQRAHRIMFHGQLISALRVMTPPEDPPYLYFSISLDTSVTEIHQMNRELTAAIVERLPQGAFPQGIVASFSKAHRAELQAAA